MENTVHCSSSKRVKRSLVWIVLGWAVLSGCFVTDLFVCPWTAVFR